MMGWTAYKLVYQSMSPIHIGWHTLGYINLTRYYIPGRTMWGAFTANLTRAHGRGVGDYKSFGDLLREHVLVSYFYPALDPEEPLLPKFAEDGLRYGPKPAYAFERQFIKSYGQTAVLPDTNTAEDQSLHESEFIAPVVEEEVDGSAQQKMVYFVGYLFIRNGCVAETKGGVQEVSWDEGTGMNLRAALSEVFVGGDRTYGWGRLRLDSHRTIANTTEFFNAAEFVGSDERPVVRLPLDGAIPAHLSIDAGLALKGDIEPLVSREWNDKGPGQAVIPLNSKTFHWMPGSILMESGSQQRTFSIGPYGILVPEDGDVSEPS